MSKRIQVLAVLLALLAAGCLRQDFMAKGQKALAAHEYPLAEIYFKKAIRKAPHSDQAYFGLGQALLNEGRYGPSYAAFSKAASLNPANEQAQAKVGDFLIAGKRPLDAEQLGRAMLRRNPGSLKGGVLLGEALAAQKYLIDARSTLLKVIHKHPKRAEPLVPLAVVDFEQGHPDHALKRLDDALRLDPHATAAYMLKASYLRAMAKTSEALKVLRAGASANPDNAQIKLALAEELISTKQIPKAEKLLGTMAAKGPGRIQAQTRLALLEIALKKPDKADALIKQLEGEQHGSDPLVIYDRARLLLARKDLAAAHKQFEALVKVAPNFGPGFYFLGETSMAMGKWQDALSQLRTAAQLSPRNSTAYLLLSAVELNNRQFQSALSDSTHALALNGNNPAALVIRGDSLTAQGHYAEAEKVYREVQKLKPEAPIGYERLGEIALRQHRYKEAAANFETTLGKSPSLAPALNGLALALSNTSGPKSAIARIRAQIKVAPKNAPFHALLAGYLVRESQLKSAVDEYKQAQAIDPGYLVAYDGLADAYRRLDNRADARATLVAALKKNPDYVPALMTLGQMDDGDGHPNQAAAYYEKVLASNPYFAPAANNLAWDYFETNRNLDKALSLAQRARAAMPNNPNTADTLAAIMLKRGLADGAKTLLEECVKNNPKMAIAHYHLGLAMLALKKPADARKEFDTAIALGPKTPLADKARRVLDSMHQPG